MSKEPIHSGHFMTSNPHSEIQAEDEDEDVEVDVVDVEDSTSTSTSEKHCAQDRVFDEKPVTFYKFGPQKTQSIAIDVSLNKLNKCIKVAYMKMTTPKWKDFKGLKLQWKHRIRLNNVIWRAYYMEFRKPDKKKKTPYCYFAVPDDDTTHTKIEGSVLEGMYWKRRMEAVCAQYKRWRTYNRHASNKKGRTCCRKRENSCGCDQRGQLSMPPQSQTPQNMSSTEFDIYDDLDNVFTNALFENLDAPFLFPYSKDNVQCSNADIIQPGLLSLQPSIEEIMSSDFDYPFSDDAQGAEALDAFIDRISRDPSSFMEPSPQQQQLPQPLASNRLQAATPRQQPQFRKPFPPPSATMASGGGGGGLDVDTDVQMSPSANDVSGSYSAKEYAAANMLIDYSNHQPHQLNNFGNGGNNSSSSTQLQPSSSRSNINVSNVKRQNDISINSTSSLGQQHHTTSGSTRVYTSMVSISTPPPLYSQAFYNAGGGGCGGSYRINNNSGLLTNNVSYVGNNGTSSTFTDTAGTNGSNISLMGGDGIGVSSHQSQMTRAPVRKVSHSQQQQQQHTPSTSATSSTLLQQHLQPSSQQQQQQQQQQHYLVHPSPQRQPSLIPQRSPTAATTAHSLAAATLDHYVPQILAAAVGVSTNATMAAIGSLSTTFSGSSLLNNNNKQLSSPTPPWWMNAIGQQPSNEDDVKALQFLCSTMPSDQQHQIGTHSFTTQAFMQPQGQQQLIQQPVSLGHPGTGANDSSFMTLLQSAQQQPQHSQHQQQRGKPAEQRSDVGNKPLILSDSQISHLQQQRLSPASAATFIHQQQQQQQLRDSDANKGIGLCSGSNATPLSVLITASSTAPINSFTSALTTLNSSLQPSVGQCTTTSAGISSPAACSPIGIAYDRSRGSGGNGIDGPSAAILQFHQQCQQQQNAFQPQTRSLSLSSTSVALSNSSPTAVPSNHLERSRQKYLEQVQSQQQQQHPAPLIAKFSGGKQYVPKNFSQQQLFTPQQQQQPPQSLEYANDSLSSAENDPSQFTSQQQLATSNAPSSSKVHSLDSEASAVLPSHFKNSRGAGFVTPSVSSGKGRWSTSLDSSLVMPAPVRNAAPKQLDSRSTNLQPPGTSAAAPQPQPQPLQYRQRVLSLSLSGSSAGGGTKPSSQSVSAEIAGMSASGIGSSLPTTPSFSPPGNFSSDQLQHQKQNSHLLHYTEMTTAARSSPIGKGGRRRTKVGYMRQTSSVSSSPARNAHAGMDLASPNGSGNTILSSSGAGDEQNAMESLSSCGSSSASSLANEGINSATGDTSTYLLAQPIALGGKVSNATLVKKESDEKPSVDARPPPTHHKLIPSGSKRRKTGSAVPGGIGSRSEPADSTLHPEERKRILHLHAEKNRRSALKEGFDALVDAIPNVEQAGVKSTNAVVLNRAARHLQDLKKTYEEKTNSLEVLKAKIAQVNDKIALIQSNLPSNSRTTKSDAARTPGSNAPSIQSQIMQFFERYSKERSKQDYRFWLMSEIFNPIVQSYAENISENSADRNQFSESARQWLDRWWNSAVLRPIASETLVRVATASGAFTDETALPKYITSEIEKSQ